MQGEGNYRRETDKGSYMNIEKMIKISQVCHEANRAYCQTIGDNSQLPWSEAPQWQRDSALKGVELHLSGDHGPQASHDSWRKEKIETGWVYGEVKDPEKKTHPCMVDFDQLPKEQQIKDFIFLAVVRAFKDAK